LALRAKLATFVQIKGVERFRPDLTIQVGYWKVKLVIHGESTEQADVLVTQQVDSKLSKNRA
jgi:hypothetical protein